MIGQDEDKIVILKRWDRAMQCPICFKTFRPTVYMRYRPLDRAIFTRCDICGHEEMLGSLGPKRKTGHPDRGEKRLLSKLKCMTEPPSPEAIRHLIYSLANEAAGWRRNGLVNSPFELTARLPGSFESNKR